MGHAYSIIIVHARLEERLARRDKTLVLNSSTITKEFVERTVVCVVPKI